MAAAAKTSHRPGRHRESPTAKHWSRYPTTTVEVMVCEPGQKSSNAILSSNDSMYDDNNTEDAENEMVMVLPKT